MQTAGMQVAARAAGSGRRSEAARRCELRRQQLDDLKVKAGMNGVLQLCRSSVGQQVAPGTNLARVANPTSLKAELRIAETQTKDIRIGQNAEVDTRNGIVKGHVTRIDPASQNGTVGVDVILERRAAAGRAARPERRRHDRARTAGQRHLRRPPGVRPGAQHGRPLQGDAGRRAPMREQVKLGRSSVNTVEIVEGLQAGRSGDSVRHVARTTHSIAVQTEVDGPRSRQLTAGSCEEEPR